MAKAPMPLNRFFFDVSAWRGSRSVQRMSFAERGVYFEMLLEQWERRNLPDNADAVADAIASSESQVAEVLAAWTAVRRKFLTSRGDESRIYNEPLERTRRQQREYRRQKQDAGAKGGKAKAVNHTKDSALEAGAAIAPLGSAVAKAREKSREEKSREDQIGGEERRYVRAASAALFDEFWSAYPKKKSKDDAKKAWDKRKPDRSLLETMLRAIVIQRDGADWQKNAGQFIPNPATWINGARWTDVPDVEIASTLSETARHNLASMSEMQRILLEREEGGREH